MFKLLKGLGSCFILLKRKKAGILKIRCKRIFFLEIPHITIEVEYGSVESC